MNKENMEKSILMKEYERVYHNFDKTLMCLEKICAYGKQKGQSEDLLMVVKIIEETINQFK